MCVLVRDVCGGGGGRCQKTYISSDTILHHFWTQDINWHLVSYKLLINWSNGCYLNPLPSDLRHFNIPEHLPFWNAAFSWSISYLLNLSPLCLSLLCILPFIRPIHDCGAPLGVCPRLCSLLLLPSFLGKFTHPLSPHHPEVNDPKINICSAGWFLLSPKSLWIGHLHLGITNAPYSWHVPN